MIADPNDSRVYTIHWNDLGKYLKRGMQVITVTPGPGAESTMLAVVPDELVADLNKSSKSRRKISLREILVDLAGWASFKPGDVRRAVLSGGLGIDVICGIDGMWRLQIWRQGSEPSAREWETVLKSWPTPLPEVTYKRFANNQRQYMRGEWKVSDEPISGDLPGAGDDPISAPAGDNGSDGQV
jgi:hypothetical protein